MVCVCSVSCGSRKQSSWPRSQQRLETGCHTKYKRWWWWWC